MRPLEVDPQPDTSTQPSLPSASGTTTPHAPRAPRSPGGITEATLANQERIADALAQIASVLASMSLTLDKIADKISSN